jgi:eukaryotic-like serine/threonine-protein kinase
MHSMLDELLNRWEEGLENGQAITPEQLCEDHPELLEELREQIQVLQAVDARFGAWSPSHEGGAPDAQGSTKLNQTVQVLTVFHIDRLHAAGGLGEVYLASDPQLNRIVAIKYPRASRLSSEQMARFEREAQVTGQLNHPGVVPVFALKQDSHGKPCYVMRFVDGPTLQERIEQLFNQPQSASSDFVSSLAMRQLLQSFVSLCNIVAYAHEHGIVHRDIKPANVILGKFGETMLMDWGLAKRLNEPEPVNDSVTFVSESADTVVERSLKTRAGQFMGTPAFASPEQRQGRVDLIDARTDAYSLGATLLTILTGSVPSGESMGQVELRNRSGGLVPRRLLAICEKARAIELEHRYQSVVNLREDVERYLAGEPISVVKETVWSSMSRIVRRRSGLAAALLVGVSMAIIAGAIGSALLSQKNQQLRNTNNKLEAANAKSLASQQRSASTTDLLAQAIRAATPEVAQGKEPTVRQLLGETSKRLRTDNTINPLVAADTHQILAEAFLSIGVYETAQEHTNLATQLYKQHSGVNSSEALHAQASQSQMLSRRDQDAEAIVLARDALERGRTVKDLDPETLITLIDIYGHVLSSGPSPDFAEIVAVHREAYQLANEKLGPNHRKTLLVSSNLAVAMMDAEDYEGAEALLNTTHQAHTELLGKTHPETLVDGFNLIALRFNRNDFQAAKDLAIPQRAIYEEILGSEHQRTIRMGLLISKIEFELGNFEDAEQVARTCLEKATKSLGPVHQHTLEARGILTTALVALKRLDEADSLAIQQYATTQEEFGELHSATLQAVTLLFDVAEAKGDSEAMEKWFEKLKGSQLEEGAAEALQKAKEKNSNKQ